MTTPGPRRRGRCGDATCERGSGLLSTVFGVMVLMALLGLATNVALGLWERTTIDAVAYDAAREVATAPNGSDVAQARAQAIARAREILGKRSDDVQLEFVDDPAASHEVVLHVRSPGVSLLPRMIATGPVVAGLDRRITVWREAP